MTPSNVPPTLWHKGPYIEGNPCSSVAANSRKSTLKRDGARSEDVAQAARWAIEMPPAAASAEREPDELEEVEASGSLQSRIAKPDGATVVLQMSACSATPPKVVDSFFFGHAKHEALLEGAMQILMEAALTGTCSWSSLAGRVRHVWGIWEASSRFRATWATATQDQSIHEMRSINAVLFARNGWDTSTVKNLRFFACCLKSLCPSYGGSNQKNVAYLYCIRLHASWRHIAAVSIHYASSTGWKLLHRRELKRASCLITVLASDEGWWRNLRCNCLAQDAPLCHFPENSTDAFWFSFCFDFLFIELAHPFAEPSGGKPRAFRGTRPPARKKLAAHDLLHTESSQICTACTPQNLNRTGPQQLAVL